MILETVIGALVPVAAEGIKGAVSKWFGNGVKATTIDEKVKLDASEIEKLKAIASLDTPGGTPSQYIVDIRAGSRYILGGVVILAALGTMYVPVPAEVQRIALESANVVFGFLFGSRVVAGWRTK